MIFEFENENLNHKQLKEVEIYVASEENLYLEALSQIRIFSFCEVEVSEERHVFSFNSDKFPTQLKGVDLYGDYILICRELFSDYPEDNFRKVVIDIKYYPQKFLFLVNSVCYFKQIDDTIIIEEIKISDPIHSLLEAINNMEEYVESCINDLERVPPNKKNITGGFYRKKYYSNQLFFKKYRLTDIAKIYSRKNANQYSLFDFSEMIFIENDGNKIDIFHWDFIYGKSKKLKLQFVQIKNAIQTKAPFTLIGKIMGNRLYIYDIFSVADQKLKTKEEKIDYLEVFGFSSDLVENKLGLLNS
jgi:hypothetical protein